MSNLTVRRPAIDVAALEMPPQWLGGDAFRTQLFNAMSMMFPIGEQYFIDSAREGLPLIDDPALAEDVRRFIGQEATHSRLHRIFNGRLEEQGLRFVMEPFIAFRIRTSTWIGPLNKMAVTMAYEHFTAAFGDAVLGPTDWLEGASEPMRVLWTWHAAEESEHRSVVFDVYRAAGGGYGRRVAWFLYVSMLFTIDSTVQTLHNLYRSGALFRAKTWRLGLRFLFGRRGLAALMAGAWFAYLRPGFSPWDGADTEAPRAWLERNAAWFGNSATAG
ncbi:metal-dependent hydrolase [Azospirillum sp. sgz301742]